MEAPLLLLPPGPEAPDGDRREPGVVVEPRVDPRLGLAFVVDVLLTVMAYSLATSITSITLETLV